MKIDFAFYWSEFSWKMYDIATILFDDTKNDLRALPKTVRLQILTTLSAVWSTAFSIIAFENIYEVSYTWGWLTIGHVAIIIAAYITFHAFKDIRDKKRKNVTGKLKSWDECIDFLGKKK